MIRRTCIWLFFCAKGTLTIQAQEPKRPEIDLEDFVEHIFQVQDENINYDDLYESLFLLYTNPINLNTATKDELASIYVLSLAQINNFMNYRAKNGSLLSIYELQSIEGFDLPTIRNLHPFVEVRSSGDFSASGPLVQRIWTEKNNYFILRTERVLEKQKGYTPRESANDQRFIGSPYKVYGRFLTRHSKDFSVGFTFEKDPGEQTIWNPDQHQYGFDYYSAHFMKENLGNFKKVIIGDYQLQFGQGLLFGAGFNPGKGAETITTVRRNSTGIRPYSSVLESGFFRGVAATYQWNNLKLTPFYSRLKQDANIEQDEFLTDFDEFASSIQHSNLHRTERELANKDAVSEQTFGANLLFDNPSRNFQAGITFLQTDYSTPLFKKPNNYNQFEFQGDNNHNAGAFFNYSWENFLLFGEGAMSKSGGFGLVGGFITSLTPQISLSMVMRNYQRDFHTFYGNAFGENSRNINEKGVYWGLKITPSRRFFLTAFYDKFSFPWLRYRTESPSDGFEYLARANYKPSRSIHMYLQYRAEGKELTINPENGNLNRLEKGVTRGYQFSLDYNISKGFSLKSKVLYGVHSISNERGTGFLLVQDLNFDVHKFQISTRMGLFDIEESGPRLFVYEKDVLYSFSIRGFSQGRGVRNYILLRYKASAKLNIWLRYARTNIRDTDDITSVVGSGLSATTGNTYSDIKAQVRYKF